MSGALVVGLFVGGRGSRFGGVPKGNLRLPNGTRLIERLLDVSRSALPETAVVLVGERMDYADLGLSTLADSPPGIGPLGGLRALLAFARDTGRDGAVALACDMPYVTDALVRRLAHEHPEALSLAPREQGFWHPLVARYSTRALPAIDAAIEAREHSLKKMLARLGDGAVALPLDGAGLEVLGDWDCPEDL